MPTPPNSCAKSSDLRAQAPSGPIRSPRSGLFCAPPRRVAAPRPVECHRVSLCTARPFAPARKPCNARAPTFGYSPCNVSDIAPRPRQSPTFALSKRNPLLPHRPTSLIHFTAMFHTALSALTAFYRTTVVILPLGHHRTLHLHTLPALLLIPYLAQLN